MREKIVYVANDGTEFNDKNSCIAHEGKHICPNCNGRGKHTVKYNAYPQGLPDSMWATDFKYKDVPCETCNGNGYTDKLLKPVTKIVGYE